MSDENSEWSDVTIPEKVDFEVEDNSNEEEVIEQSTEVKTAEEIEQLKKGLDEAKKEPIKELDGIETSGAQKRIRNLVRQRKERDERIQALLKEKTDLEKNLRNMERTYVETQKANSSVSQKQLEEQMALAKNDYIEAKAIWTVLEKNIVKAINSVIKMRASEGKSISQDVTDKLKKMLLEVKKIQTRSKRILSEKKKELNDEEYKS